MVDRLHFTVYFGEVLRGHIVLIKQPSKERRLVLGFFNLSRFRAIYGLDSDDATAAFGAADVVVNLVAGWAVGVALLLLSPQAIGTYLAFEGVISTEAVFRLWAVCVLVAVVTCLTILYTAMPCVIGLTMEK